MKALKWYSIVIVTLGTIACFINGLSELSQYPETATSDFWGGVLFIPVAVYMWMQVKRKEQ